MSVATDVIFQLLDSFSQDYYDDDEEMDFYSSLGPAVGSKFKFQVCSAHPSVRACLLFWPARCLLTFSLNSEGRDGFGLYLKDMPFRTSSFGLRFVLLVCSSPTGKINNT